MLDWCWLMLVYVGWCCSCPNLCWNCLRPFGFRQQHVLGSVGQRAWKSHWPRIHKDSTWPSVTHVNDFWTFALLMPHFSTCSQNLSLLLGQRMSISCSCWFCDNMYQHATCPTVTIFLQYTCALFTEPFYFSKSFHVSPLPGQAIEKRGRGHTTGPEKCCT